MTGVCPVPIRVIRVIRGKIRSLTLANAPVTLDLTPTDLNSDE